MAGGAVRDALADAGVDYDAIQQAYVGYVYGDSTCGQRALYGVGLTGIPVVNVNNNCSTGSTALFLARQAVESGAAECVLALGFEQMQPGALGVALDRPAERRSTRFDAAADELRRRARTSRWRAATSAAPGPSHMQKYGTHARDLRARSAPRRAGTPANNPLRAVPRGGHRRRGAGLAR